MVKNIKKCALLLISALLLLAGCKNISTVQVKGGKIGEAADISVGLAEITNRAAMGPATLVADSTEIAVYTVSGVSKTGLTYAATDFTPDEVKDGSAVLATVPYDDWTFTMIAYADAGKTKPVLRGTSVCNMKSNNESNVTFTLSSYGLTTVGSYKITIKYTGTAWQDGVYSFKWGLSDPITGEPLSLTGTVGTSENPANPKSVGSTDAADIHMLQGETGKKDTANDYYLASTTGVKPGSYIFGVTINSGTTKLGYASEILIIEPGRETVATLTLDDNIIQSRPNPPEKLIAQRIEGTENDDFFDVRLAWEDKSDNEDGFELIIRQFTNTTEDWAVIAGAPAATSAISESTVQKVYDWGKILTLTKSSDVIKYVGGSLYSGSQELILRFPMGTLYDVQIRAVNVIGSSATINRIADSADKDQLEKVDQSTAMPSPASTKTFLTELDAKNVSGIGIGAAGENVRINLLKITYYLDGGTLTLGSDTTPKEHPSTKSYVEYKPYTLKTNGSGNADKYLPLLEITASDPTPASTANTLVRSGIDWQKWILPSDAQSATPTAQTFNTSAYQNFSVIAVYDTVSSKDIGVTSTTIEELAHLSFDDDDLSAFYGPNATTANATDSCKNGAIKLSRGAAAQYVTVTVNTNALFKRYVLYVGENPIEEKAYAETSITFTNFSTDRLAGGGASTCIRVDAFTAGDQMASASFYIRKTN